MPITALPASRRYDFDYAAALALFGRLAAPPALSENRCEAYLLEFTTPVSDDYDTGREYQHGLLLVTRGRMGGYAQAMTVVAADAEGEPLADEDDRGAPRWYPMEAQAHLDEVTVEEFLRRVKLPV